MDSKLQQARNYEEIYGDRIPKAERPLFHVVPRIGWMNDPNGFSVYKGEYHLFYQYYPYNTSWGPMHWGHVKTKDLIRWEWLPAAIAPDAEYDNAGCFSGSAVEMPDGRQLLMYTGVRENQREDGFIESRQMQCIAFGDGVDYEKYENNPVLTAADLPEGGSAVDFRDPKIWRDDKENCFYVVVANRTEDGSGAILLYRSEDAVNWKMVSVLDRSRNEYGRMWECPDFFMMGDCAVLITSPQEMLSRGRAFHNGFGNIYLTGTYDPQTYRFVRKAAHAIDYGLDFYAPQTLESPDGRRIMIAWMQSWESSHDHTYIGKWFGMMTLPRELSIKKGRLIQQPVRELEQYRANGVFYTDVDVQERIQLPEVQGRCVDMTVTVRPSGGRLYERFIIKVAKDTRFYTSITYSPGESILTFDRSNSGLRRDIVSNRDVVTRFRDGKIKLRIIIDLYSVEVFVNGGEQALSSTIYTEPEAEGISFEAEGMAIVDVEKYDIVL